MQKTLRLMGMSVLCGAVLGFIAVGAYGQAVYGSIYGVVTDPTGAAIPGARVTITSVGKGTSTRATTNARGNYVVTHVLPGKYDVRAEATGFKSYEAKAIEVFADTSVRVDAALEVGAVGEVITVTAEDVPLLKSDRADVATTFTEKAVTELPILDRNFTKFQLLTPGTQPLMWQHASSENPQQGIQIMVNGQHFSGTAFQLDGTANRDPILGIIVINPTLDSVTQTKITSQNYDAEFGQALAGVVTAQTRSGTNEVHGSAFWFRRNDLTQARDPFTQATPDPVTGRLLPETLWTQFGGSLGGPLIEDKLFIFGDYQGTRRNSGASVLLNVPTSLVRATCLNPDPAVGCDLSEYPVQIFDPLTGDPGPDGVLGTADDPGTGRTPFPGNIIPKSRISSEAIALLQRLPGPNAGAGIENNFSNGGAELFDDDAFNLRLDHNTSENLKIFGRYSFADFRKSAIGTFGEIEGGLGLSPDGFAGKSLTRNQSLAAGFDYVISPTLLTDFRFGFFRYRVQVVPNGIGTSPASDAGIPGLNLDDFFTSGMPAFFIEGLAGFNFGYALGINRCNCPLDQSEQQWQWVNNWTNIRGNHTFKFGADIRYAQNRRVPSDQHRSGQLFFGPERTQDTALGGGLGLASLLLGDVRFFNRFVSSVTDASERQHRWFFYGQDTWRATPKLTVNYGVRWEIYFPESVTDDAAGGWIDFETGLVRVGGVGDIDRHGDIENTYKNIAPRLGIAYQATEKTIIRLGYGRSFDLGVFGSIFGHAVTQNLPVLATQEERGPGGVPWLAAFNLATGPPTLLFPSVPPSGVFPLPPGVNQFVRPLKMRLPTIDQWNLTIQHQLTPTMTFEVGYVGNKATHVDPDNNPDHDFNQPVLAGFPAVPQDQRRPFFPKFGWNQGFRYFGNDSDSNYNSLQVKLEKRFSQGYQLLGHYTWAKGLNFANDCGVGE